MTENLESMCRRISLSEGEKNGITVSVGEIADVQEKGDRCLVGRIWSEKYTNKEAFKSVLSGLWRTMESVVFKELQDNLWLFEFADIEDKERVLAGRPWTFDRQILVINEFDGKTPPSQMEFMHSPFWIQVHDLPLLCMTKNVGIRIGESLGCLEDVDMAGDGAGWGRCLRIRVRINLEKPLERGRAIHLGEKSHWASFKYEKLPLFCFHCGRIVYGKKGCPMRQSMRVHASEELKEWGIWLRAEIPR
jgi:hypothetical protein